MSQMLSSICIVVELKFLKIWWLGWKRHMDYLYISVIGLKQTWCLLYLIFVIGLKETHGLIVCIFAIRLKETHRYDPFGIETDPCLWDWNKSIICELSQIETDPFGIETDPLRNLGLKQIHALFRVETDPYEDWNRSIWGLKQIHMRIETDPFEGWNRSIEKGLWWSHRG